MVIFRTGQTRSRTVAAAMIDGGGISSMWAALDLTNARLKVFLGKQTPYLSEHVTQLGLRFTQHDRGLCRGTTDHGYGCTQPSISPAYNHYIRYSNIEILTTTHALGDEGHHD